MPYWICRSVHPSGTRRANPCSLRSARPVTPAAVLPVLTWVRAGAVRVQPHRRRPTRGGPRAEGSGLAAAGASFRCAPRRARRGVPGGDPGCAHRAAARPQPPGGGSAGRSLAVGPRLRRPALRCGRLRPGPLGPALAGARCARPGGPGRTGRVRAGTKEILRAPRDLAAAGRRFAAARRIWSAGATRP